MLTRCPDCATHFRVTPEQLKARAGRVRCGECQHVFNALDTLIEEPVLVIAAPGVEQPAAQSVLPVPPQAPAATPEPAAGIAVEPAPTSSLPETTAPEETGPEIAGPHGPPFDIPLPEVSPASAVSGAATLSDSTPAIDPLLRAAPDGPELRDAEPLNESDSWEEPAARRWPWALGSFAALLALGVQAALAFRVEIAVIWPQARPALAAACEVAGCELGLPAKVGLVGIESSDLYPDATQKGRLVLVANLKNRAPFAQAYPHLELTLTDTTDKAIVRKVLAPGDYLPRTAAAAAGMAPNADVSVNLSLDAGGLPASGYRLYIFYP
jgi:predicted Zn finger-like uncharacterized protein